MAPPRLKSNGQKLRPSQRVKVRLPPKQADGFYLSPEWRGLMDEIVRERGRRCEDPAHDSATPRECGRIYGDHVKELRDGGAPLEKDNVMLRCPVCHGRKTARHRALRYRGAPTTPGG